MQQSFQTEIGGRTLQLSVGKFAPAAHAAVTARYGDTVVLATVVMNKSAREGIDYFPLLVDYEERLYAAGKIKGSRFIKRETRPSDEAVLSARMIDRSIRPLFPEHVRNDVQVILTILSVDGENDPDIPSLIASSAALAISPVPWDGPIAGIRVGRINGEWVLNPTYEARSKSTLDLVVATREDRVLMVETLAHEEPEAVVLEGMKFAVKHTRAISDLLSRMAKEIGTTKLDIPKEEDELAQDTVAIGAKEWLASRLPETLFAKTLPSKKSRKAVIDDLQKELEARLVADSVGKEKRRDILDCLDDWIEQAVTRAILEREQRVDGRKLTDIRPLLSEVALLPRTHGSGLFQRGETQVLSVATLGAPSLEQTMESIEGDSKKRYMHHYNFPPYSVAEVAPLRGAGRREIGHGALAEKAILPVLPEKEKFPYAIRVVSEVLSSNGSSSMASTCGSTLALMDAGVPITAPVAGIAMGLASNNNGDYKILTDLQDLEDGKGGMDFKIAGTKKGITAIQMDTKTLGLTLSQVEETLEQGRVARMAILEQMATTLPESRKELSQYAPRILTIQINPEKIRDVIGPGGKVIHEITDKTGATIDIEQTGFIFVTSVSAEGAQKAIEWIKNLTREVAVGEVFTGKVTRLMDFGAFVEVLPKQEGLVHISELAPYRVARVSDVVNIGDEVEVKVIGIDELGRINLSRRALLPPTTQPRSHERNPLS